MPVVERGLGAETVQSADLWIPVCRECRLQQPWKRRRVVLSDVGYLAHV